MKLRHYVGKSHKRKRPKRREIDDGLDWATRRYVEPPQPKRQDSFDRWAADRRAQW